MAGLGKQHKSLGILHLLIDHILGGETLNDRSETKQIIKTDLIQIWI